MSKAAAAALMISISLASMVLIWRLIDISSPTRSSYDQDRYEYSRLCVESRGWPEVSAEHSRDWHCHEIHWKIHRE